MRAAHLAVLSAALLGGGFLLGGMLPSRTGTSAGSRPRVASRTSAPASRPAPAEPAGPAAGIAASSAAGPKPTPGSIRERLAGFETGDLDIGKIEEEWEARLAEDPAFAGELYAAFLEETDPAKLSFLSNLLASDPGLRNDPAWQDRFMTVAETDGLMDRRIPSLLFLQQAESVGTVRSRMFALIDEPGDIRFHALVSLKGLPDRRTDDPELAAAAARIAETGTDAELRGLALRIEQNPEHAARFLGDPEPQVRMQAAQEVNSLDLLQRSLEREMDSEAREVIGERIEVLEAERAGSDGPHAGPGN